MSQNLAELSLEELAKVIESAQKALEARRLNERKNVIAEIHKLAASIGVTATISGGAVRKRGESLRGVKVAPKYRNPNDASETWTGRGVKPKWLKALTDAGRKVEDFLI
jgi:DNA-binding protein H-NS